MRQPKDQNFRFFYLTSLFNFFYRILPNWKLFFFYLISLCQFYKVFKQINFYPAFSFIEIGPGSDSIVSLAVSMLKGDKKNYIAIEKCQNSANKLAYHLYGRGIMYDVYNCSFFDKNIIKLKRNNIVLIFDHSIDDIIIDTFSKENKMDHLPWQEKILFARKYTNDLIGKIKHYFIGILRQCVFIDPSLIVIKHYGRTNVVRNSLEKLIDPIINTILEDNSFETLSGYNVAKRISTESIIIIANKIQ